VVENKIRACTKFNMIYYFSPSEMTENDQAGGRDGDDYLSVEMPKLRPNWEEMEQRANLEMACSLPNRPSPQPVSPWDVLEALQVINPFSVSQSLPKGSIKKFYFFFFSLGSDFKLIINFVSHWILRKRRDCCRFTAIRCVRNQFMQST